MITFGHPTVPPHPQKKDLEVLEIINRNYLHFDNRQQKHTLNSTLIRCNVAVVS